MFRAESQQNGIWHVLCDISHGVFIFFRGLFDQEMRVAHEPDFYKQEECQKGFIRGRQCGGKCLWCHIEIFAAEAREGVALELCQRDEGHAFQMKFVGKGNDILAFAAQRNNDEEIVCRGVLQDDAEFIVPVDGKETLIGLKEETCQLTGYVALYETRRIEEDSPCVVHERVDALEILMSNLSANLLAEVCRGFCDVERR